MKNLGQFNPAKSLFVRVFLWFWLASLVIFLGSIWLVKQLDSDVEYHPINRKQQRDLTMLTRKVQNHLSRGNPEFDLNKRINRIRNGTRFDFVLIDSTTRKMTHNLPRRWQINHQVFDDFTINNSALVMDVKGTNFIGPSLVRVNNQDYLLFLVRPRPKGDLRLIRYEYPEVFVLLLLTLSASLCYLFVRGILTPIKQLRLASKRMATGEMGVRVANASKRLDEIGQLGRDFNHMSEQVENLLSSQKRLLADISHELRSPLTRLQLSIGIAQQQSEQDMSFKVRDALTRIEKESQQIEDMLARVLLLSRLENNQPTLNLQVINLEKIMAPIINDALFEAEQKNKTLVYQAAEDISIRVDPQLLSSAIENVIRNGIHYSNQQVKVSVLIQNKHLVWNIEDDGNGIEESHLSKIFEAFYRESSSRDRYSGGVGLGLAIALYAIQRHKGVILASNNINGGLLVKIQVPYLKP
ncbi:ATP-binding protein [uncultured Paraglaciecola sp.]|uniref:ATP-binding protein n=1 Tax=uncultured Paraglaciecola sp. TaxID=1765024 RepID=UPI0026044CEC|nr:ATP-binding protein [uncultured Paraglaciecola sp.]